MKSKALFLAVLALIGSTLACSPLAVPTLIPTHTPTPPPTETPTPLPTDTSTPTASPTPLPTDTPTLPPLPTEAEVVQLDLCTLLTPEEVEAVLGTPVTVQPSPETGNCSYVAELGEGDIMPVSVALSAGHGEEGKGLMAFGIALLMFFTGGEGSEEEIERLLESLPDMTVQEVVAEGVAALESVGYEVTPYDGIGDEAYWLWYEEEYLSIGELIIVQGESWLAVIVVGLPEDEALLAAGTLAGPALERLPPAFLVLPHEE